MGKYDKEIEKLKAELASLEAKNMEDERLWVPKKPTLCWVSDRNEGIKDCVDLVDIYDSESEVYVTRCEGYWNFATPLTAQEIKEYSNEATKIFQWRESGFTCYRVQTGYGMTLFPAKDIVFHPDKTYTIVIKGMDVQVYEE